MGRGREMGQGLGLEEQGMDLGMGPGMGPASRPAGWDGRGMGPGMGRGRGMGMRMRGSAWHGLEASPPVPDAYASGEDDLED